MMRLLAVVCLFLIATSSASAQRTSYETTFPLANCNNAVINAGTLICGGDSGVKISGFNGVTFFFKYVSSTGVGFACDIEVYDNSSATWYRLASQVVSGGVSTLSPFTIDHTVGSGQTSAIVYNVTHNYDKIRLGCKAKGAPGANDRFTVGMRSVYIPAF